MLIYMLIHDEDASGPFSNTWGWLPLVDKTGSKGAEDARRCSHSMQVLSFEKYERGSTSTGASTCILRQSCLYVSRGSSRKEHLLRIFTSPEEHRFMRVCVVAGMCRPIHRESNVTSCAGTEMTRRYTLNLRRQHGNTQYEKAPPRVPTQGHRRVDKQIAAPTEGPSVLTATAALHRRAG